jgi:hypothetical protein
MTDYAKLAAKKKKEKSFASSTERQVWETRALNEFFKSVEDEIDREIKKARKSGIDLSITKSQWDTRLYTSANQQLICAVTLEFDDVGSGTLEHWLQAAIPGSNANPLRYRLVEDEVGYSTGAPASEIAKTIVIGAINGRFD